MTDRFFIKPAESLSKSAPSVKKQATNKIEKAVKKKSLHPKRLRVLVDQKGKVSKNESGYKDAEGSFYACRECEFWVPAHGNDATCVLHRPGDKTRANGTCRFFSVGEPIPGRKSTGRTSKSDSGYKENPYKTGFRCNRCTFYTKGQDCRVVDRKSPGPNIDKISPEATCDLWEVVHDTPVPIEVSKGVPAMIITGMTKNKDDDDEEDSKESVSSDRHE